MASAKTVTTSKRKVLEGEGMLRGDRAYKLLFLLPAVIIVLFLSIFPLVYSLVMAFTNYNFQSVGLGLPFNGLANWSRAFQDDRLWNAVKDTVIYVGLGVVAQYLIGLGLALLLNQSFVRFRKFWRVVFLLPMMMSPVAVSYIVGRIMFATTNGPVNDFLKLASLPAVNWIADAKIALYTLVLVDTWQWTPFIMIMLLAGLQSLPEEPHEAARIDGASAWQAFRYVTFPMLIPVSVTAVLIRSLELFKIFDVVHVVTGGGPGRATESVTFYAYLQAMRNFSVGYGSTIAFLLLIMVVVVTTVFLVVVRRKAPDVSY